MTDQPSKDSTAEPADKATAAPKTLPGLGSLFAAAASANARKDDTPKGKAGGDQHEKRIHMAPRNTRRSMGKR